MTWSLDRGMRRKYASLEGKHVMLVGASSGIGLEMAKQAAAEGAYVSIIARNKGKLANAQTEVEACIRASAKADRREEPRVHCIAADAASFADMKGAVESAISSLGPISAVVCCQGVCRPHTFDSWAIDEMHEHMDVNFWATVNALKAGALDSVKQAPRGTGRVLLVSSQAGQAGVFGYTAYSASKFALRGLAESLQQELLPYDVRVGMLFPPDTDTPQLHEENLTKSTITKEITSRGSKPMTAAAVAAAALKGMRRGDFLISANFDGFMLNIGTAGMAPPSSITGFIMEVLLAGIMRIVAVITLGEFRRVILKNSRITSKQM